MTSWISIASYLWKNTFKRWFEHPVSPASKILVPLLLGLFTTALLTLFSQIENQLRSQLEKRSIYSVFSNEFVRSDTAQTTLHNSYQEELSWMRRYSPENIKLIRQPLLSGKTENNKPISILAYGPSITEFQKNQNSESPPTVWKLDSEKTLSTKIEKIKINDAVTIAEPGLMPSWIQENLSITAAVAVPIEILGPQLRNGFFNYTLANFSSLDEVKNYVQEMTAYYSAENREVKIFSSIELLENLEKIIFLQKIIRSLVVIGVGIILSLIFGSIAWLEFRQESYLLALLRSFGTPSLLLLIHMCLENIILVALGLSLALISYKYIFLLYSDQLNKLGIHTPNTFEISNGDILIIASAGLLGILIAMIPISMGLRKPVGLILQ